MGCILPIIAIFMPRLVLALIFLFTHWFSVAFQTILWPLLGFLLMPYTTLVWLLAMVMNNHQVNGIWLILLIAAVVFDLGGQGGSARRRRS